MTFCIVMGQSMLFCASLCQCILFRTKESIGTSIWTHRHQQTFHHLTTRCKTYTITDGKTARREWTQERVARLSHSLIVMALSWGLWLDMVALKTTWASNDAWLRCDFVLALGKEWFRARRTANGCRTDTIIIANVNVYPNRKPTSSNIN